MVILRFVTLWLGRLKWAPVFLSHEYIIKDKEEKGEIMKMLYNEVYIEIKQNYKQ